MTKVILNKFKFRPQHAQKSSEHQQLSLARTDKNTYQQ